LLPSRKQRPQHRLHFEKKEEEEGKAPIEMRFIE